MSQEIPTIEEENGRIINEEIADLEWPIRSILKEMLPNIERGEYDLIIGIDASGRIPTLIIEKFIKYVYSKRGLVMPDTRFLAGNIEAENVEKQIEEWGSLEKALIIEDTISTGASISALCSVLDYDGIRFDIATIAALRINDRGEVDREMLSDRLGAENIFFGTFSTPSIYGRHDLGGVEKEGAGESFSQSHKQAEEARGYDAQEIQGTINEARKDTDVVVNNLINWYESQKSNN